MSYSPKQVEMLRKAILQIHQNDLSDRTQKEVSFSSIGTQIEKSFMRFKERRWAVPELKDIDLPNQIYISASPNGNRLDKLRKFATGKQQTMEDLHLFALLIFLTDDETKGSSFSIEAFNSEDDDLTLPSLLAKLLSPIGNSSSYYRKLSGKYSGERTKNGIHSTYNLNLEVTKNPLILKCIFQEKKNLKTKIYSGWSVFTEHDSLVFFLTRTNYAVPRLLISNSCMNEFYNDDDEFNHAFICSDFEEIEEIDNFLKTLSQLNNWLNENSSLSKDAMIKFIKS